MNAWAVGLARNVEDGIRNAPSEPSILFPENGGNIHSFTALTPCAILDVLSPPYSEEFGRPSTYFSEFPIPALPGNPQSAHISIYRYLFSCTWNNFCAEICEPADYTLLEEKDLPGDLVVIGAPYLGPPLSLYKCTNSKACIYT